MTKHSVRKVRGAVATGHVRYILAISLVAAVVAIACILVFFV